MYQSLTQEPKQGCNPNITLCTSKPHRAAPASLLAETSLLEAGRVLAFLKSLGIPAEFLSARVLCTRPALLARNVDTQLQPVGGKPRGRSSSCAKQLYLVCHESDATSWDTQQQESDRNRYTAGGQASRHTFMLECRWCGVVCILVMVPESPCTSTRLKMTHAQ